MLFRRRAQSEGPEWLRPWLSSACAPRKKRTGVTAQAVFDAIVAGSADARPGNIIIEDVEIDGILSISGLSFKKTILFNRCVFKDSVDLIGLSGRTIGFIDSELRGGVDARDIKLDLHFLFRNGSLSFGPVLLRDADIGGFVDCTSCSFLFDPSGRIGDMPPPLAEQHEGQAFGCSRMRAQTLLWQSVKVGPGALSFRNASVSVFRDDLAQCGLASWRGASDIDLLGFLYETKNEASYDQHIAWLECDPFALRSGARTLVNCLERSGSTEEAHQVLLWARRNLADGLSGVDRRARLIYLWMVSLSFDLKGILRALLIVLVAALLAVELMWRLEWIAPDDIKTVMDNCHSVELPCRPGGWGRPLTFFRGYRIPIGYPAFETFQYAINLMIPYLPGSAHDGWSPANAPASLILALFRGASLALQAMLFWNVVGRRELR